MMVSDVKVAVGHNKQKLSDIQLCSNRAIRPRRGIYYMEVEFLQAKTRIRSPEGIHIRYSSGSFCVMSKATVYSSWK